MSSPNLQVLKFTSADLPDLRNELLEVYAEVYADRLDDPFFSTSRYWERLEGYGSRDGFAVAVGRVDGEPIGYSLGYTLPAGSGWWKGLQADEQPFDTQETGKLSFALTEIMVRERWRRHHNARKLHDTLLANRSEERATLLVLLENAPAKAAYASWGWHRIGTIKPFSDSPVYDSMTLQLRDS